MHRPSAWRLTVLLLTILPSAAGLAGCVGPWRPSREGVAQKLDRTEPELADYLQAGRTGRWIYERRELPAHQDKSPVRYARRITDERFSEGLLLGEAFLPLKRYLEPQPQPTTQPTTRPSAKRPHASMRHGPVIFFQLGEPLPVIPRDLDRTQSAIATVPLTYFDHRGRLAARGTLTRTAWIEGYEDVTCPAGRFERCLRVRVDLQLRFPWVLAVDWTSYLWLSPEVGEVRRVQKLSGWFLIFWFGSAHEYQLVQYVPTTRETVSTDPAPTWSTGAILLRRAIPHPEISGMVIDFAPPATTQ